MAAILPSLPLVGADHLLEVLLVCSIGLNPIVNGRLLSFLLRCVVKTQSVLDRIEVTPHVVL